MKNTPAPSGPSGHRLLILAFSLLFGLLVYWFLGFIVNDIGSWRGPAYAEIEERMIDPEQLEESRTLNREIDQTTRDIAELRQRQQVLRDSATNSERTMNQLLEVQRLTLEKGVAPNETDQQALTRSKEIFLANQESYQELNERIGQLSDELRTLESRQRNLNATLDAEKGPVLEEYRRLDRRHAFKIAAAKLLLLTPLLVAAVFLYLRFRTSLYRPLIYAFGTATLVKVLMVMHQHFPRRFFKYILIVAALALVVRILIALLRMVAHPKREWLLRQYREAYERYLCPICSYPIRRGPLRYAVWIRRRLRPSAGLPLLTPKDQTEEPYVCPVCSTRLFETCGACRGVRASLLPACDHCGDVNAPPVIGEKEPA